MSLPTETLVIHIETATLAQELRAIKVLMEAVPLAGGAIFRGAWRSWSDENGVLVGRDEIFPDAETQAAMEALFTKAMRSKATDDAATIREADYQHSKAHNYGRNVRHARNTGGYRRRLA